MTEEKKIKKPLPVRRGEAMADLIRATNDIARRYDLPYHVLDDIFFRVYSDIKNGAESERAQALLRYEQMLQNMARAENQNQNQISKEDEKDAESYCQENV